jgi:ABC-2 type transport system ATP-binding protein
MGTPARPFVSNSVWPGSTAPAVPLGTSALRRSYGRLIALQSLTLAVAPGDCVALIGANGSGKTTAVRAIAGLLEPTGGTVRVSGWDPHREPEAEHARAALALVLDSPLLYDDLTVRQHLELVTLSHGAAGEGVEERISSLLLRLGLQGREGFLPGELSRGMRQKTQLACALIRPASVLVLDEPVVGLDPPSQTLLHDLLLQAKQAGTAILLTTHQMAFADGLADRGVLLEDGIVADEGPGRKCANARGDADGTNSSAEPCRQLAERSRGPRVVAGSIPRSQRREASGVALHDRARGRDLRRAGYGTASLALAQVVTPHSLAVLGPSLALLAVLLAMHWGAYQGPVVFSVPDVAFLLGAPLPRRALAIRRLVFALAGGAVAGTVLAAVVLVGLAGKGRGIDTADAAGLIVGLTELGTICVVGAWAVERSKRFERASRRVTWPGMLTALGLAVVSGAGSVGREVAFWAGPWGWALQSDTGVDFAHWVAALLALTALTAVAAGAALRTCGEASGERHLRRAEARAGAIASLSSFDARTARQTLAAVISRDPGRSRSGLSWLRASLATRGSQPAARTLAILWRTIVAALRTPGRVVEAAALAAGGTLLSLLNTDKIVAVAAGMVLAYPGASRMLWPLRADLDLPSRTTVMLRPASVVCCLSTRYSQRS